MAAAMAPALAEPPSEVPPEKEAAVRGRQAALWSRARSLCRRLRALQAQQVERHVRQQLAGLVRYMGRAAPTGLPPVLGPDLRQLAASATARLRSARGACDSDATDSSSSSGGSCCGSGGETDSESPEPEERPAPASVAHHRAECQWAMERAAIICQWTWLQAQVSDLEYRIRQQTDIYRQLRANKGPVVLGGDQQPEDVMKQQGRLGSTSVVNTRRHKGLPHSSSSILKVPSGERQCDLSSSIPSYFLHNVEKQNSRLTQSLGNPMCQSPSCTPISGSPGPPKACTSPRQVNGKINCLHLSHSNSSSLASLDAEEILKQKRLASLAAVPSVPDNSCVAARIRPICRYKKRKLVRANTVSHLSKKPQKPLTMKCSCEWPSTCILCGCKTSIQAIDPDTMSLEERIALLDSGFHPILSFSHGKPLHLHFDTLLREERQHRLSHKLKALKMSHFGKKPQDLTSNVFPKLGLSPLSASSSLFKGERQLKGTDNPSLLVSSPQTHKHSPLMHHLPSLYLETPTPSSSQFPSTGNSTMSSKKRKVECSYDINNIVIPMSMAAATRVEKLQYKEILTPSWRVVEPKELEPLDQMDSELEDTSDETYLNHHTKYEELERARWDSWAAVVSHKRGSRTSNKLDGRWTPQPPFPDTGFHCLNELLYMHSSTESQSPEPYNNLQPVSIKNRTRALLSCTEDTRFSSEILEEVIQSVESWEPRTFPLSDTAYQALLDQPSEDGCKQTADFQRWDSGNKQGIRTNSIDSSISNSRESSVSDMDLETDGNKSLEVFTDQQCFPGRPFNNR